MAFSRGPYAYQENLPAPAETYIATSRKIDFARGVYVQDAVGNPEAMADTAQRVALTVAFEAGKPPTIINERTIAKRRKDIEAALFRLVREGAIRNVRVIVEQRGARLDEDVLFEDALSTRPTRIRNGKLWTSVSWIATAPGSDGTLALPSWLTYECATAETSAQTSASTVRTGFAAHAPRAVSRDGVTWGLAVEKAATNQIDEQLLTSWTASGATLASATTPAGTTVDCEAVDDSAGAQERLALTIASLDDGSFSLSTWMQAISPVDSSTFLHLLSAVPGLAASTATPDAAWVRRSVSASIGALVTPQVRLIIRNTASHLGSTRLWGMQLETGLYPTSFIGADNATFTRAAGSLMALSSRIAPHGYFDVALTYAPQYAHSEVTGEHDLLYVDDDNRCYYDGADDSFHLVLHGAEVATVGPVTFSRDQALTVRVRHLADGCSLTIAGATTGNGTDEAGAVARIAPAKHIHILGDINGAQEGAALQSIVSTAA